MAPPFQVRPPPTALPLHPSQPIAIYPIMGTPGLVMRMTARKVTNYCPRRHSISQHGWTPHCPARGPAAEHEAPAAKQRGSPADARVKNVSMPIGHTPGQTEIAGQPRTPHPPQYPRITPEPWQTSVIRHLASGLEFPRASRREAQPDCVPGLPHARIEIVLATACAVRSPTLVACWAARGRWFSSADGAQSAPLDRPAGPGRTGNGLPPSGMLSGHGGRWPGAG
jgi:hypothetical protein